MLEESLRETYAGSNVSRLKKTQACATLYKLPSNDPQILIDNNRIVKDTKFKYKSNKVSLQYLEDMQESIAQNPKHTVGINTLK